MRVKVFRKGIVKHVWAYWFEGQELGEVLEVKEMWLENALWCGPSSSQFKLHASAPWQVKYQRRAWVDGELLSGPPRLLVEPRRVLYNKDTYDFVFESGELAVISAVAYLDTLGRAWAGTAFVEP